MELRGGILLLLHLFLQPGDAAALELLVPSVHRAKMGSETLIPCTFTVDKPPVDPRFLVVFWYFQRKEILTYDDTLRTSDTRFSINTTRAIEGDATLTVSRVTVADNGVYKCAIMYLPKRKGKEVSLFVYAPPNITITERLVVIDKKSILNSSITGFYPVDIDIKWFRDGEILNNHTVSTPQRNPDGTYSVNSTVTIIPTEEDKYQIFSCRVQHESLSEPLYNYFTLEYKHKDKQYIVFTSVSILILIPMIVILEISYLCIQLGYWRTSKALRSVHNATVIIDLVMLMVIIITMNFSFTVEDVQAFMQMKILLIIAIGVLMVENVCIIFILFRYKTKIQAHEVTMVIVVLAAVFLILTCLMIITSLENDPIQEFKENDTFLIVNIGLLTGVIVAMIFLIVRKNKLREPENNKTLFKDPLLSKKNYSNNMLVKMSRPHVEEINLLNDIIRGQPVTMQCKISGFYPNNLTVTWLKQEIEGQEPTPIKISENVQIPDLRNEEQSKGAKEDVITDYYKNWVGDLRYEKLSDGTYSCTASLTIYSSLSSEQGAQFICRVEHPSLMRPIERWTEPLQVMALASPPHVDKIIVSDVLMWNKPARLECEISGFYPDNLTVDWLKEVKGVEMEVSPVASKYEISEIKSCKQPDGRYSCTACMVFTPSESSEQGIRFICRIEHPRLSRAVERKTESLQVMVSPRIEGIVIPDKLIWGQATRLQCKISEFYPDKLTVTWIQQKKGILEQIKKIIRNDKHQISDLRYELQLDNTYSCTAFLDFTPLLQGVQFICRVEHPSMDQPVEIKTGPLHVTGCPSNMEGKTKPPPLLKWHQGVRKSNSMESIIKKMNPMLSKCLSYTSTSPNTSINSEDEVEDFIHHNISFSLYEGGAREIKRQNILFEV